MRTILVLILSMMAMSCERTKPAPIVQTAAGLQIDTPQFHLVVPGQWKESSSPSPNTIYAGMSPSSDRQIIVSAHLLKQGLTAQERLEAVKHLFDTRVATEREVSNGQANVRPTEIVEEQGLLVGSYIVMHPNAGRVVFSRLLCDHEKALNIHWEVLQLQAAPDLKALLQEFERITDSAKLK
jgi:hypothetical protein